MKRPWPRRGWEKLRNWKRETGEEVVGGRLRIGWWWIRVLVFTGLRWREVILICSQGRQSVFIEAPKETWEQEMGGSCCWLRRYAPLRVGTGARPNQRRMLGLPPALNIKAEKSQKG